MAVRDQGTWVTVVHDVPPVSRLAGAWASVVHDVPPLARLVGSFLSVVHEGPGPPVPPVFGVWPQEGLDRSVMVQGQRLLAHRGQM